MTNKNTGVGLREATQFFRERLKINLHNDPFQQQYVQKMLDVPEVTQAIFLDAEAGTGKTSLAISTAYFLLDRGLIDQIIYIRAPKSIVDIGFLPGDIAEKEAPYMQPGLEALEKLDPKNPKLIETLISNDQLVVTTTTFLRGVDWDGKKFIIIDEAQNLNLNEMQTVLTRPHDSTKLVVIGSKLQFDEKNPRRYGKELMLPFELFAYHFTQHTNLKVASLTLETNYRGRFSLLADKIQHTIDYLNKDDEARKADGLPVIPLGPTEEEVAAKWEQMGNKMNEKHKNS